MHKGVHDDALYKSTAFGLFLWVIKNFVKKFNTVTKNYFAAAGFPLSACLTIAKSILFHIIEHVVAAVSTF